MKSTPQGLKFHMKFKLKIHRSGAVLTLDRYIPNLAIVRKARAQSAPEPGRSIGDTMNTQNFANAYESENQKCSALTARYSASFASPSDRSRQPMLCISPDSFLRHRQQRL